MDLTFSDAQNELRMHLRSWFERHRPTEAFDPLYTDHGKRQHLEWEQTLYDAGYAAPGWPVEYGGMGLDVWAQLIYDEEYVRLGLPERLNQMGLLHGGPTVLAHGTQEQKARWIPGILTCTDIWCQGFSEPDAGSDLAALRTTGRIEGDRIVINGQKIWTSRGPIASTMFALVRTDPDAVRHRGLSFIIIDLNSPGIEVRPLSQLHGQAGFAEVFLSNVEVPVDNVVGDLHDGWRVAQTSLQLERGTARGTHTRLHQAVTALGAAVGDGGADDYHLTRLGALRAWAFAYEQASYAATDAISRHAEDPAFSSILKLRWSETQTAVHEELLSVLGSDAEIVRERGPGGELLGRHRDYWHSRAAEIYAGSNEIQRNIIAERMLGLPKEPRG